MEAVGLAIGIVGLAGLFKTALEAWEFVDSARDQAQSLKFFRTRLDNQRVIFIIWAERMGFYAQEGYNRSLDLPPIRAKRIADTLEQMALLFSDTAALTQLYGLKVHFAELQVDGDPTADVSSPARRNAPAAIFRVQYNRVRAIVRSKGQLSLLSEPWDQRHNTSIWKRMRWSIRDEKKTDALLTKIVSLIDDLEGLTRDIQAAKTREQYATEVVEDISEAALYEIEDSSRNGEDVISSAASIRLSSLRRAQTLATTSISSASFFTAESSPHGIDAQVIEFSKIREANHGVCVDLVAKQERMYCLNVGVARRIQKEITDLAREEHPEDWFTISPLDESNLDKWLGTFRGPAGTPYEGGVFHVRMNLTERYPWSAPRTWFITKIIHPNVDKFGAICLDILGKEWSPALTLTHLIVSVASILDDPAWDNPIQGEMPSDWTTDRKLFDRRAREWTKRFATGRIINPGERDDGFYNVTENAA